MARIFFHGYESQETMTEGLVINSGTPVADTSVFRSGSASVRYDSGGGFSQNQYALFNGAAGRTYFARAWVRFGTSLPNSGSQILMFRTGGAAAVISIRFGAGGVIQLWNETGTPAQIGSSSAALSLNTWYRLDMECFVPAAGNGIARARLGGVEFAGSASVNIGTATLGRLYHGYIINPGASRSMWVDDVAINDDLGSVENSYPADGRVINLLPIADGARGEGITPWTGGAGGSTDKFDAINNAPPIGTASETDLTQIEHPGGAPTTGDAWQNFDVQSYTTGGVGASDTIVAVQPVCAHGEDIATGTKMLELSNVSNPAIASLGPFTAGGNVTALGTFPTNWAVHKGGIAEAPSVTLGTSPVIRILRPETASRVASVCYMALIVEYQEASGTPATMTVTTATAPAQGEAVTFDAASALTVTTATAPSAAAGALTVPNALVVTAATSPASAAGNLTAASKLTADIAAAPAAAAGNIVAAQSAVLTVTAATAPAAAGNSTLLGQGALPVTSAASPATAGIVAFTAVSKLTATAATSLAAAAGNLTSSASASLTVTTAEAPASGGNATLVGQGALAVTPASSPAASSAALAAASKLTLTPSSAAANGGAVTLDAASRLTVTSATAPAAGGGVTFDVSGNLVVTTALAPAAGGGVTLDAASKLTVAGASAAAAGGTVNLTGQSDIPGVLSVIAASAPATGGIVALTSAAKLTTTTATASAQGEGVTFDAAARMVLAAAIAAATASVAITGQGALASAPSLAGALADGVFAGQALLALASAEAAAQSNADFLIGISGNAILLGNMTISTTSGDLAAVSMYGATGDIDVDGGHGILTVAGGSS